MSGLIVAKAFFRMLEWKRRAKEALMGNKSEAESGGIYAFEMNTIEGTPRPLAEYKGKVCLIINTASKCGFTPQYEGLEKLHAEFKARGLRVLGFPSNDFGAQEPGSEAEIKEFCSTRYRVSFDLFAKIRVKGEGMHPLYEFLTKHSGHNGDIPWNFSKFLVDREGRVAARFGPDTEPLDKALTAAIEAALAA